MTVEECGLIIMRSTDHSLWFMVVKQNKPIYHTTHNEAEWWNKTLCSCMTMLRRNNIDMQP